MVNKKVEISESEVENYDGLYIEITRLIREIDGLSAISENTGLSLRLARDCLAVACEVFKWIQDGETAPITRYGYAMEKLEAARRTYEGLEHNDSIPTEVE